MLELKQVLCAIDFSESSDRVVGYAAAFARWYDANLTVLHVVVETDSEVVLGVPTHGQVAEDLRRSIASVGANTPNADVSVREGHPVSVILDEAVRTHAGLLVLGTHGRSGFNRFLLGSVSEKLVRRVLCPVLTVPALATRAPSEAVQLKRILCPLDFSPSSMRALQYARSLAQETNGSLTVLHVIEWFPEEETGVHAQFHEYRRHLMQDARARLHAEVSDDVRSWCNVDEVVTFSRAYREILSVAKTAKADLIVMGAQGRGVVDSLLFGSTTEHVLRETPCPVLTLRAESAVGSSA